MNDTVSFIDDNFDPESEIENPDIDPVLLEDGGGRPPFNLDRAGHMWCYARRGWQNSGFDVRAGQKFALAWNALSYKPIDPRSPYSWWEVRWTCNPNVKGVYGAGGNGIIARQGYVLPGIPEGSLVYRIRGRNGVSEPRSIANEQHADQDGHLELVINDDLSGRYGAGLSDNRGRILVFYYK